MSVSFSTHVASIPATSTFINHAITVGGTNPVLIAKAGINSAGNTVTSVTWSLGGGTAVNVTSVRDSTAYTSIWAVPAPAAGAGTLRIGFSASSLFVSDVALFIGAHQTTPCPAADSRVSNSHAANVTVTPGNLTANDASDSIVANTVGGNWTSVAQNQRTIDNASDPGYITGDSAGTTGISWVNDGTVINAGYTAVRIQAPSAAGGFFPPLWAGDLDGLDRRFAKNRLE